MGYFVQSKYLDPGKVGLGIDIQQIKKYTYFTPKLLTAFLQQAACMLEVGLHPREIVERLYSPGTVNETEALVEAVFGLRTKLYESWGWQNKGGYMVKDA